MMSGRQLFPISPLTLGLLLAPFTGSACAQNPKTEARGQSDPGPTTRRPRIDPSVTPASARRPARPSDPNATAADGFPSREAEETPARAGEMADQARNLPPRKAPINDPDVKTVSLLPGPGEKVAAHIIARVDNESILLEQILPPARRFLEQAKSQLPPEKFRELEWETIRKLTMDKVDRKVLIKELERKLPNKDAIARVTKMIDRDIETNFAKMARQMGLKDRDEFAQKVREEGLRIEELRDNQIEQILSQAFLEQFGRGKTVEPSREEMFRYWREHADDFRDKAGAVWRHIEIAKKSDPEAAYAKLNAARARIARGEKFEVVAKETSEGATAISGGLWPLTSPGSFAIKAVDQAIFAEPIGQVSAPIDGGEAWHLILVEKRSDGSPRPFKDCQRDIRDRIQVAQRKEILDRIIKDARKNHHIETIFDNQPAPPKRDPQTGERIED